MVTLYVSSVTKNKPWIIKKHVPINKVELNFCESKFKFIVKMRRKLFLSHSSTERRILVSPRQVAHASVDHLRSITADPQ